MRELLLKIYKVMQRVLAFEELAARPVRMWQDMEAIPAVLGGMLTGDDVLAGCDCPPSFLLARADANPITDEADADLMEAVGAAVGMKARESADVTAICLGAESYWSGDFAAAARRISRWNLPVVLICQPPAPNASRPWEQIDLTVACEQLGLEHAFVDATDAMKLMPVLRCAVERAREGDGATVVECQLSYEDDASPSDKLRAMLLGEGYATGEELDRLAQEAREEMHNLWQGGEE